MLAEEEGDDEVGAKDGRKFTEKCEEEDDEEIIEISINALSRSLKPKTIRIT